MPGRNDSERPGDAWAWSIARNLLRVRSIDWVKPINLLRPFRKLLPDCIGNAAAAPFYGALVTQHIV